MKILVTGAAGFVGLHIVRRLAEDGAQVLALARRAPDAETLRFLGPLGDRVRFVAGDVRDRAALVALVRNESVCRIVHGAAVTSATAEHDDPASFVDVNLGGTLNLLEAARLGGAERVVLISSSAIYGAPTDRTRLIHEDDPLQIGGLYTICKQAGEQLCRRYHELYGLSAVVGRLGTAYGPMERPTGSRATMSQVHALVEAARLGHTLRIYGAERLRDVCHIDDVAEAFSGLALAERLSYPIYNVSAGTAHSLHTIARAVSEVLPKLTWLPVATPEQADLAVLPPSERGRLDLSRLEQDLGFRPRYDLMLGIDRYVAWLRSWEAGAASGVRP